MKMFHTRNNKVKHKYKFKLLPDETMINNESYESLFLELRSSVVKIELFVVTSLKF